MNDTGDLVIFLICKAHALPGLHVLATICQVRARARQSEFMLRYIELASAHKTVRELMRQLEQARAYDYNR